MAKMTLEKLGIMIKEGFDKVDEKFVKVDERFVKIDERFDKVENRLDKLENRMDNMIDRMDKLERGQEDIILKLDNKADKIDFPEIYPEFTKQS